jgi:signal transduction histidine kinase/ActR/RegA family two-component response regulator
MLKAYKKKHKAESSQFILLDNNGYVMESDDVLFAINTEIQIQQFHPFFSGFTAFVESKKDKLSLKCLHIDFSKKNGIVDVEFIKNKTHVLLILQDFTDHYNEYQLVAQARNESVIKSELIVLKNKELEAREAFKNEFIQNFSHELRNPLTNIISITNALGVTNLPEHQQKMVDYLKESNSNLKLMLEDILGISMIASGKMALKISSFNLRELAAMLAFTYKNKGKEKGLKFVLDYDEKLPEYVEGDKLRILQILTNLLENAIKYTLNGTVTLKIALNQKRANQASIRFAVTDTGIGIAEENKAIIFDSFYRLNRAHGDNGVGLGLSIVKSLLHLMKSEIKLDSKLNDYTTFYFDLSLKYQLFTLEKGYLEKKASQNKLSLEPTKKYKILIVEDDEMIQMALFQTLAKTGNFLLELISDGALVIQELIANTYDMVIIDVKLPNTTGDTITKMIRELPMPEIKKIPILGLTGNAYEDQLAAYKKAGMNAILTKPYEVEELLKVVFKLCKHVKK